MANIGGHNGLQCLLIILSLEWSYCTVKGGEGTEGGEGREGGNGNNDQVPEDFALWKHMALCLLTCMIHDDMGEVELIKLFAWGCIDKRDET